MDIRIQNKSKKIFSHITSIEISETWDMFVPRMLQAKDFMKKIGIPIISTNKYFLDIICLNSWLDTVTSRALFHVQSLERRVRDVEIVLKLERTCDITILQFFELLKIHNMKKQYCGLHTNGALNIVYLWPPKKSFFYNHLFAISFFHTGGNDGGWVLTAAPIRDNISVRSKGVRIISRCFAQDGFPV